MPIKVEFLKRRAIRIKKPNKGDGYYRVGDEDALVENAEPNELRGYAKRGVLQIITVSEPKKKKEADSEGDVSG